MSSFVCVCLFPILPNRCTSYSSCVRKKNPCDELTYTASGIPAGRCVLFQQQRLAAFLQAGLLLPAQEESLTVRATRTALAKLDADPSRLLN